MFLLEAAEEMEEADGHYSGWNPARAYDFICILPRKTTLSLLSDSEGEPQPNQPRFVRKVENIQVELSDNSSRFLYKVPFSWVGLQCDRHCGQVNRWAGRARHRSLLSQHSCRWPRSPVTLSLTHLV